MKCPHCEKEIPGSPCPKCGEAVFEDANYCMACGTPLKEELKEVPRYDDVFDEDGDFDLEDRVLCPDGTCTGIIIDGKCTECGRMVGDDGQFVEMKQEEETVPEERGPEEKEKGADKTDPDV